MPAVTHFARSPQVANIRDYGGLPGVDVSEAWTRAVAAVPAGGGRIYFPFGTWHVPAALTLANRQNITISGDGTGTVLKRTGAAVDQRLFTIGEAGACENITLENLSLDVAGITRFGGCAVYNTAGFRAEHVRLFDSALQDTWQTWDHLGLIVQLSTDVAVEDCTATDVELIEHNACKVVRVRNNVVRRAAGTAAIGWYSHPGAANYCHDFEIVDNVVIDPRRFGIAFSQELNAADTLVRGVRIAGNKVKHETIAGGGSSIGLGYTAGADATTSNNDWAGILVERNTVDCIAAGRTTHALFMRHNQTSFRFRRAVVRDNVVNGVSSDDQVFLRQFEDGVVARNYVQARVEAQRDVTARGFRLEIFKDTHVDGNFAEATERAYAQTGSLGSNRHTGNRVGGTPTTPWLRDDPVPGTDSYADNEGGI